MTKIGCGNIWAANSVFKQSVKALQFVALSPDPAKIQIREQLRTEAAMPVWKRRKLEFKLSGFDKWQPRRRLNEEQMALIKSLFAEDPSKNSYVELCKRFHVSFEAIRRIIKS